MSALLEGWHALVHMTRQEDEMVDRLEARHMKLAQRTWNRAWPDVKADLVTATDEEAMTAALARAGEAFGDHLTDRDEVALVTVSAQSYSLGQVEAVEDAVVRARQLSFMEDPGPRHNVHERVRRNIEHAVYATKLIRSERRSLRACRLADKGVLARARLVTRVLDPEDAANIFDANIDVAMTVRDRRAAAWLARDNLFWVREVWNQDLGQRISNTAMTTVLEGGRTSDVAAKLKERLGQFDEPDSYWDVLANSAVVRGRSMGSVSGFNAAGVATFRFLAVNDERTSPICQTMNGKIFTLEQANAHVDAVLETNDPDELKAVSPWVQPVEVAGLSVEDLASQGVILPPLHGRCRSTVIVESFA